MQPLVPLRQVRIDPSGRAQTTRISEKEQGRIAQAASSAVRRQAAGSGIVQTALRIFRAKAFIPPS
jgi:hypothetical protein